MERRELGVVLGYYPVEKKIGKKLGIGSWQREEGLGLAGSSPRASQILEEFFGKCQSLREADEEQLRSATGSAPWAGISLEKSTPDPLGMGGI